ncbi:MAG: hypothetical protein U1E60_28540 [Reyranellaceae bacterium]
MFAPIDLPNVDPRYCEIDIVEMFEKPTLLDRAMLQATIAAAVSFEPCMA